MEALTFSQLTILFSLDPIGLGGFDTFAANHFIQFRIVREITVRCTLAPLGNAVKDFAKVRIWGLYYAIGVIFRSPGSSRSGAPWVAM